MEIRVANIVDYTAEPPTREVLLNLRFHRQSRMLVDAEGCEFELFFLRKFSYENFV